MKTIDLRTTQNATITYELAPLLSRILAFVIDLIVMAIVYFLLRLLGLVFLVANAEMAYQLFEYLIIGPVVVFYSLISESLMNGQTLGKMALGIRVVRSNGKRLETFDLVLRWAFRMIDIWLSMGVLASLLISTSNQSQRLGGIVSNTIVVKLSSSLSVQLADLLKINTLQNYEPLYPEIRQFKESDMLLIKKSIERYQKYKNPAHKEVLSMCAKRVSTFLSLEEVPEDEVEFLKTAIKDYIVLTR